MSLFTDASRVTAIGATSPFGRVPVKDRSPPQNGPSANGTFRACLGQARDQWR
jgi:hypothetical protein